MKRVLLFDLDGTLLPMNTSLFWSDYKKTIAKLAEEWGYESVTFMSAITQCVVDMKHNDGRMRNVDCFKESWTRNFGDYDDKMERFLHTYFSGMEYVSTKSLSRDGRAIKCIKRAKELGYTVALTTDPIAPLVAVHARMKVAGLDPADFEYITYMGNSNACKPNLHYYKEVLEKLSAVPENCTMIGNDIEEDMIVEKLGISTYLVTDWILNVKNKDISHFRQGTLGQLLEALEDGSL